MGVMADHIQVIAVFVITWAAAFDVVDLRLQVRFFGGIFSLHRQHILIFGWVSGAGYNRANALAQHGTGRNGVHQQANNQKESQHDAEPFLVTHDIRARLLRLFLDRLSGLAGLAGSLSGTPRSLTGALGGGIFLFNGLLLLPAGDWIAGQLGIFPQRLLIQGVDVGLFQLLLRFRGFAVGFQLMAAIALPNQMRAGFQCFLRLVGAFHTHIV